MKHSPKLYATAFAEAAEGKLSPEQEKKLVKNLLKIVEFNGDGHRLMQILAEAERLLRKKSGKHKVVVESARALTPANRKMLARFADKNDVLEEKISPELGAGVKIVIDEEKQLDFSLRRKLEKLFASS